MDTLPSMYAQDGEYVRPVPSAGATVLEGQARTAEAAAQQVKDKTTFGDLIGAKVVQGPIAWADRALEEHGLARDPDFYGDALTPYFEKWRAAGLENQTELLEGAFSPEQADLRMSFAMQNKMAQDDSAQFGLLGNAAAGLLDPSLFAIGAASGGLGYAASAGRLTNAVRAGLVAGATNVGTEALSSQYDPEIDTGHLVVAGAFGAVTGGVFGFRAGELAEFSAGVNKVVKGSSAPPTAAKDATDSMGAARVPGSVVSDLDGPAVGTPEWQQKVIDEAYANAGTQSAFSKVRRDIAGRLGNSKSAVLRDAARKLLKDSVGYTDRNAAVKFTASEESALLDQAVHGEYRTAVEQEWAKFSAKSGVRGDVARQKFNESIGYHIRGVAQDMEPEVAASAQRVRRTFERMTDELRASGVPGFEQPLDSNGYLPRIFSAKGYTDLNSTKGLSFENLRENLVKPAMRKAWAEKLGDNPAAGDTSNAFHARAQAEKALQTERGRGDGFRSAVTRAEDDLAAAKADLAEHKTGKAPHRSDVDAKAAWNAERDRINERVTAAKAAKAKAAKDLKDHGNTLADLTTEHVKASAAHAAASSVDEDLLHAVSEAWLKRGYEKAMGGPSDLHGTLAAADASSVRELLEEAGVDAKKIDALVTKMEKDQGERALHARAKSRIDIDESYGATLTDDLGNTHEVHLADLLENNVDNLVPDYIREMSGWAALKKHANIGTQAELDRYKQFVLQHSKQAGDGDLTRALDITFNSILGRSTSDAPNSAWTRGSRLIRSQNFMTTMGQVGFTMLEGVGSVLGAVGMRNAFKAAPAAVDMIRKMRMGNFDHEEAAWLADITGLGTDFVRNQPYLRLDAVGESVWRNDSAVGRGLNKLDRGMQYGQRYMSVVSGIAPMQQFLQGFAGVGIAGRLVQLANKEGISASMVRRLRAGGLDAQDQAALFARLKGMKSVHDISKSWGSWTADEKRLMALFVNRNAKRTIGEGGVGDSVQLMHSATGRIFTQFRTFMTNSYTSVMLHGLHMRDWQTAQMWMGSTLFAGIGMAARNYINTTGDPEKREKLMQWDELAKQAFQQSSYSSILPFMTDTIAHDLGVKQALGGDDTPVFAYGRSTGLDSGVQGIPTLATGRALWGLPKTLVAALDPKQHVNSKQARDAMSLLWFQNVTGVRNGLSWAAKQLPEGDLPH